MDPTNPIIIFKSRIIKEGQKEEMNNSSLHKPNSLCPSIRDGCVMLKKKKKKKVV